MRTATTSGYVAMQMENPATEFDDFDRLVTQYRPEYFDSFTHLFAIWMSPNRDASRLPLLARRGGRDRRARTRWWFNYDINSPWSTTQALRATPLIGRVGQVENTLSESL